MGGMRCFCAGFAALVLGACTRPPSALPAVASCQPDEPLRLAELAMAQGQLLEADRLITRVDEPPCQTDGVRRLALSREIARRLGDGARLDPFAEIASARAASQPERAREHWDRATRALELQTGSPARPVYLRLAPDAGGQSVRKAAPIPYSASAKEVLFATRRGVHEPIRLVESSEELGAGGAVVTWSRGQARWLQPELLTDPVLGTFPASGVAAGRRDRWLVACDGAGVHVFDARTGKPERQRALACPDKLIVASASRLLAVSDKVTVMDLPSLEPKGEIPIGYFEEWRLDPSGRTFVAVEGGRYDDDVKVRAIDLESAAQILLLDRPQPAPLELALSPNGRKLLLVDESSTVVDLPTKRASSLGSRVFYPFRPGFFARNGWGDLYTPPARTGSIAVLDDGRACVEQGGTAGLLPHSANEHCSIGPGGEALVGRARSTNKTRWVLPAKHSDHAQRTALVSPGGAKVFRLEQAHLAPKDCGLEPDSNGKTPPCPPAQVVVVYDGKSGLEVARHAIGAPGEASLAYVSRDGATLGVIFDGSEHEAGELRELDLASGALRTESPSELATQPWYLPSIRGGMIHVMKQPAGVTRLWDPSELRLLRVDEPAPGDRLLPAGLDFAELRGEDALTVLLKQSPAEAQVRLGTLVPMGDGLGLFFEDGRMELFGVNQPPPDLVCAFGDVLAPFELCHHKRVEGVYRASVKQAAGDAR